MLSAAAHEFAFKTLAASLGDSLKKIAARVGMKEEEREDEEEGDVSEDEEKEEEDEEEEEEEEEEEKRKKNIKKNKTSQPVPDESAKEQ